MRRKNLIQYIISRRIKLIPIFIVLTILFMSVAYSAFSSNLNISNILLDVRVKADIRVTGISSDSYTDSSICVPVTEATKTTGNIPSGNFIAGDEYICEVKDGVKYHFFVLSDDGDNVNLILDRNVYYNESAGETGLVDEENPGFVAWYASENTNIYGPVTAMTYLHNATKDWNNIPNMNVEIVDPGGLYGNGTGYGSIKTEGTTTSITTKEGEVTAAFINLKSRMATAKEIYQLGELDLWMYNYLYTDYKEDGEPKRPHYYSLLTTPAEYLDALSILPNGKYTLCNTSYAYQGVRPVISLPKTSLIDYVDTKGKVKSVDYNVSSVQANIDLPQNDSSVFLNIEITNFEGPEMGILEITGLPDNLEYELLDYKLKSKICNNDNICSNGIQKNIIIKVKYKEDGYDSNNLNYNINMNFNFKPFYKIEYENIKINGYPLEVIGGDTLNIVFSDPIPDSIGVYVGGVETLKYTYENSELILPDVSGDVLLKNTMMLYKNGQVVYFDVENGTACTESEYKKSYDETLDDYLNSYTGYNGIIKTSIPDCVATSDPDACVLNINQNGCLKFYAFNDYGDSEKVNLLLDHNTSLSMMWVDAYSKLYDDTSEWQGTLKPENYISITLDSSKEFNYSDDDYKARLLTANEVALINKRYDWDESKAFALRYIYSSNGELIRTETDGFDFDSSVIGWLADRTSSVCEITGCLNNSNVETAWYWTASKANVLEAHYAWGINASSLSGAQAIQAGNSAQDPLYYGVRPVIEVARDSLLKYNVTYSQIENDGYPSEVLGGATLKVNFGANAPDKLAVYIFDEITTDYTYESGVLTVPDVWGDVHIRNASKVYSNGEIVYFDVDKGKSCTESEYKNSYDGTDYSNSYTGYNGITKTTQEVCVATAGTEECETVVHENQNSCLKFYAFNDEAENKTLNLLLDHNTTAIIDWSTEYISSDYVVRGPKEVIEQLQSDTSSWKGTIEPENYSHYRGYTIDYSGYKARLITAPEIAQITKNAEWNEQTSSYFGYQFHDLKYDLEGEGGKACASTSTGCEYGWLYDRTHVQCTEYGCLNNSNLETSGYWTSSASTFMPNSPSVWEIWMVYYTGSLESESSYSPIEGVRPVIEVSKNDL